MLFLTRGKTSLARIPEENRINSLRGIRCINSKEDVQIRTTNFQWQEILFPLVTRVVVEETSRSSRMRKEMAWLENVQRLAGSCLDRGFWREQDGERAWRGRKDAVVREGVKKTKRSPEGVLFTLATSNRTVAVDPLKNGFTTCCWQSHLKIPLDIERISEKEGDTPSPSIPRPFFNTL